jgi:hypothetical protein
MSSGAKKASSFRSERIGISPNPYGTTVETS